MSLMRAVVAQELSQKLEKQERTTLKLQKQLRAYTKQIQEFTGKCHAWGGGTHRDGGHQPALVLVHHSPGPAVSPMAHDVICAPFQQ